MRRNIIVGGLGAVVAALLATGDVRAQASLRNLPEKVGGFDPVYAGRDVSDVDNVEIREEGGKYVPKLKDGKVELEFGEKNKAFNGTYQENDPRLSVLVTDLDADDPPRQKLYKVGEALKPEDVDLVTRKKDGKKEPGNYKLTLLLKDESKKRYLIVGAAVNEADERMTIPFPSEETGPTGPTGGRGTGGVGAGRVSGEINWEYNRSTDKKDSYQFVVADPATQTTDALVDRFKKQCPEYPGVKKEYLTDGTRKQVAKPTKDQKVFMNVPKADSSKCLPNSEIDKRKKKDREVGGETEGGETGGSGAGSGTGSGSLEDGIEISGGKREKDKEERDAHLGFNGSSRLVYSPSELRTRFGNGGLDLERLEWGFTIVPGITYKNLGLGVLFEYLRSRGEITSLNDGAKVGNDRGSSRFLVGPSGRYIVNQDVNSRLAIAYLRNNLRLRVNDLSINETREGLVVDAAGRHNNLYTLNGSSSLGAMGRLYWESFDLNNNGTSYGLQNQLILVAGPTVRFLDEKLVADLGFRLDSQVDTSLQRNLGARGLQNAQYGDVHNADNVYGWQLEPGVLWRATPDVSLVAGGVTGIGGNLQRYGVRAGISYKDAVRLFGGWQDSEVSTRALGNARERRGFLNLELSYDSSLLLSSRDQTVFPR